MKKITIFEAFAGLGSQLRALKLVGKTLNFEVESLGIIEWYIHAIISYQIINYAVLPADTKTPIEVIIDQLSSLSLSIDSKNLVSKNYFQKMKEDKLRKIYPYFLKMLNNPLSLSLLYLRIIKIIIILDIQILIKLIKYLKI
ncbi:DNA (cytosine-5-)-methyltransferase N-terminal subunit [Mesomycoplasma ovipneumoniae]|uniref:DNA (cytosine-5-)-methyltransferase N-terminal subunit n=1 Tax=Mesomycoplasma ovipneumoniae TaxID=29562 RepID=UPI00311B0FD3